APSKMPSTRPYVTGLHQSIPPTISSARSPAQHHFPKWFATFIRSSETKHVNSHLHRPANCLMRSLLVSAEVQTPSGFSTDSSTIKTWTSTVWKPVVPELTPENTLPPLPSAVWESCTVRARI